MTQQQFIRRLKQQPKHGMADSFWDGIEDIGNALSSFVQYGTDATAAAKTLTETLLNTGKQGFAGLLSDTVSLNVGLAKTIEINNVLQKKFIEVASAATFLEKRNSVLNKGFGISSKNAEILANDLAQLSKDFAKGSVNTQISQESLMKYAVSIKKMLPTMKQAGKTDTQYYKGLQQAQFILQESIGLTEDQANAYTQYAGSSAENAARQLEFSRQVAAEMGDADGSMGYMKMITEGIAEAGADIQLQYGRLPGSLEVATIKAARLGLKLEDLAGAGESLLDIESSIGKELEYQLLTGKQLVNDQNQSLTNLYREATLRGNAADQAQILTDIIKEEGSNLENNLFARKQMADLLGIQEQTLASAIQKQKILEKAGEAGITVDIDDNGSIARAAEQLTKQGELSAAEFKEFQDTADTRTTEDLLKEQLSIANEQLMYSRLSVSVGKSRDELIKAAAKMAQETSKTPNEAETIALGKVLTILGVPQAASKEVVDSATNATVTGPESLKTKNDVMIPSGYGNKIISAGEDTFALNNDDTIVAGTNLFPQTNSGNSTLASKIDELIAEIRTQTRVLSKRDNTFGAGINSAYYG